MDAKLATLVRMHESQSVTSSLEDSQTLSTETKDRLSKAYGIVVEAARDGDRLKTVLRETLQNERAVGRSAYSTELSFHALLQAVFWALGAPQENQEGEKLRAAVFLTALQLLHSINVAPVAQRCMPLLLEELHSLRVGDLAAAVSEILRGIQQALRSQHKGDAIAVFYTIELLPQLLLRVSSSMTLSFEVSQPDGDVGDLSGTQYRHNVLTKLSDLDWPRRFFLQVLKNFRDFAFTPDEERAFCIKIYREARKELNSSSDQVRRLEMFPTVCLSVLQLVGRTQSLLCTRLLTRLLINKCQQLTMDASEREDTVSSLNTRELRELQSTVLYHFEMALRQWERLGEAIQREYEQQSSQRLSSFDVALMLLVASHHKYEQSMMQLLLRHVVSTYTSKREGTSDGHQEAIARKAFLSVVQSAQDGNLSPIVHQMIELGFLLLEHQAVKGYHGDTQHAGSEGSIDMCNTPEWVDFGVRLLLACFQYHMSVRERVMDRVVNIIIVQNANCRTYIYVMLRIVNRHIAELGGGLEARIRECLEYVTQLDPAHANYLLVALSPLLKTQPSLKEFVILVLRKAMFRKDEGSRIIGIQGFALLLCLSSRIFSRSRTLSQLYSQNVTMLSQGIAGASSMLQSSMAESDIASQEHQHAMAAEDLFRQFSGIFRRALDLQTRVRVVLYAELVKVFTECPALQESILKLIFQHYQKYYESNESVQPPLKLDLSLSRQRGMYEEPLQYLLHTMVHCYKELKRGVVDSDDDEETMMDDIPATQAVGATQVIDVMQYNFSVLFERLKRCELSDFEFDKNATFSSDSELGETNQRMGVLVMGVFQVAINWSVSQPDHKRDSSSRDVKAEWDTLLQFSQVCVWLKRKVQGTEDSQRQLQPTKKRKLTKMPMKLDTSKASRTPTSSAWTRGKELGLSFEQSSNSQWATLIEPDSLLRILAFAVSKARGENGAPCLTLEEEELVLLIAEQGLTVLELIESKMTNERRVDGKISKRQSSDVTLRFQPDEFTQHLCDLFLRLLRIYCNEEVSLILPKGSTTRKRAANADVQSQERMRSIVQISVRGFARIVSMWSHRPLEEFEEQMTRALCLKSSSNEASPDYDVEGEESDSVACALPPLRKLVDDLLQQGMPDEANRLLDVVEIVGGKLFAGSPSVADTVLSQHVEWVKELLVERSGEATPRLLEKYVALLLRPSANASFRYEVAQQLAQGLRHASGGIDPDDNMANAPAPEIQFHRVNEKQVLAIANAILANIDEALSETDRRVKVFDSEQRRHALKFKEDDLNALQQLEDETGSQIFGSETEGGHASRFGMFKTLCKQSFDLAGAIRPFVGLNLDNPLASIRIVRIAGRLFKLLVPLLRDKHRRKDASLPKFLRQLFDRVAGDLSQALLRFIQSIHSESTRSESKKSVSKSTAKRVTGKSKFIPDVVFQLEQFDLIMIKLSKLCKGHEFNAWCKIRSVRDFRLDKKEVKRGLDGQGLKKVDEGTHQVASASDRDGDDADTTSEVASVADAAVDDDNADVQSEDEDTETAEEDDVPVVKKRGGSGRKRRAHAVAEDSDTAELVNEEEEDDEEEEEEEEEEDEEIQEDDDVDEDQTGTCPDFAGNEI